MLTPLAAVGCMFQVIGTDTAVIEQTSGKPTALSSLADVR